MPSVFCCFASIGLHPIEQSRIRFASGSQRIYNADMVLIRFPNPDAKRRALAYLVGRFPFKSWAAGEVLVPEAALPELAVESIPFSVEGPAKYEQHVPAIRNPARSRRAQVMYVRTIVPWD